MRKTPKSEPFSFVFATSFFPLPFCIIYFLSCLPPGVATVPFFHHLLPCKIKPPTPAPPRLASWIFHLPYVLSHSLFFPQLLRLSFPHFHHLLIATTSKLSRLSCSSEGLLPQHQVPVDHKGAATTIHCSLLYRGKKKKKSAVEVWKSAVLALSNYPGFITWLLRFQLVLQEFRSHRFISCHAICKQRVKYTVSLKAQTFTDHLSCRTKATLLGAREKHLIGQQDLGLWNWVQTVSDWIINKKKKVQKK